MAKFVAPDLSNATPEMLVDEMAKLSVMENYIKKLRNTYKEAFYARAGIKKEELQVGVAVTNSGETFIASTTRTQPQRLDQEALKRERPDIHLEYLGLGDQLTTRFTLKEGVVNPIVNDLLNQLKQELDLE